MFPEWLKRQNCPIVVIERGIIEVNRSLRLVGMQGVSGAMIQSFYEAPGKRYRYEDIWNKEKAAEMWSFLLPDIPFDIERYEWLTEMQIQPHLGKWKPDLKIMNDLITKGALCLGDM